MSNAGGEVQRPAFASKAADGRFRLKLRVQPGAKANGVIGPFQGSLKVKIKAPPVDNKANKELLSYLASLLGMKPNRLQIESGQTGRLKIIVFSMEDEPRWELLTPK
jgi:hypothetical protein